MICPVCSNSKTAPALKGTDFLFETTSKIFTLDSCGSCRCLFLNPMPTAAEIAGFYPSQYWWNASQSGRLKKLESLYRKIALYDHVAFITKAVGNRPGLELLDVGCGSGTLSSLLKRQGFLVLCVDSSPDAAAILNSEDALHTVGRR